MIEQHYDSIEIKKYLKGRDYLLSDNYNWINGKNEEIAIAPMGARYQLNCMNWLALCLHDLSVESEYVKIEMKPLIIGKMREFEEFFPLSVKKESDELSYKYKEEYKKIKQKFNANLLNL